MSNTSYPLLLTKASYVQYSYVVAGGLEGEALVHSIHNEVKQSQVESLSQCITSLASLVWLQRDTAG